MRVSASRVYATHCAILCCSRFLSCSAQSIEKQWPIIYSVEFVHPYLSLDRQQGTSCMSQVGVSDCVTRLCPQAVHV
ncbi:hypothetical protein B0O99DRAFT_609656 [Bisporella sp. PMI_857]|nr:hypothetical protein B0O99DRAFT_609656 [Bisporella sp. PMI_857]